MNERCKKHIYIYICAHTNAELYTRTYTFSLAQCFETHRGAYSVHADSCIFLFILRLHPRGGLGAHRLMDPTFSCRVFPSPLLSLRLTLSRSLKDLEVNDEARAREGGFVWAASYLSRLAVSHWDADEIWRSANFPGRRYPWRRRDIAMFATYAAFNRGLWPQADSLQSRTLRVLIIPEVRIVSSPNRRAYTEFKLINF